MHLPTLKHFAAIIALAATTVATWAQPGKKPALDPASFTGRDFAGLRLPIAAQRGVLSLSAQRVATWGDEGGRAVAINPTVTMGMQRMLLRGDVRITLAYAEFRAARAVVWIEPIEESRTTPGAWVQQVAVYFDRLSDPAGEPGITPTADRILVTAVVDGPMTLRSDVMSQGRPGELLVVEAERRFARYLRDVASPGEETEPPEAPFAEPGGLGTLSGPIVPGQSQPFEPASPLATGRNLRTGPSILDSPGGDWSSNLFNGHGIISFSAGEAAFVTGGEEDAAIITGGVVVQYTDARNSRSLEISAERAVVFIEKGAARGAREMPASKVLGIFLEGDVVASDGRVTLRGARVYYDVPRNRATAIDAVFWTYDQQRGLPIYVRAKALRQTAAQRVSGDEVTLSASAFFEPQFSLAASRMTVTRQRSADEVARTILEGKDVTPRFMGLPFFYWPSFTGDSDRFVLKDVRFENSSDNGFGIKTRWDIFGILGVDRPGWTADLLVDGWVRRGVGLGVDLAWKEKEIEGNLLAYMVPVDSGTDLLPTGEKIKRNDDFRGLILGEHRWNIDEHWTLFLEASHISDETFVPAYYHTLAETRREFTNAATIRYLGDNSIFTGQLKGTFNDFLSNEYLLQSQGYAVNKVPELVYGRVSDDLLSGSSAGLLTWSHEYRVGLMSMAFSEPTAAQLGFSTVALAFDAFGTLPGTSIGSALRAAGLNESPVLRADTRQEFDLNLHAGPVNVTPFVVGRLTAYDKDFAAFAPADHDQVRFWGAGGVRADMTFQRVYEDVSSDLLDLHRLRHIVEPSVIFWGAGTNREQASLPVFDERVESIAEGATVRAGITQVWQTQRGDPGRQRSVDVLRLSTDIVWSTADTPRESPIGRFFDYRPEYSMLGRYFTADMAWQATDSVGFTLSDVYDFDRNQQAHLAAGVIVQHSEDFSTFAELHFINARNATYLDTGVETRLTPHYTIDVSATIDVDNERFQGVGVRLSREFEAFDLGLRMRFNAITDEVAFGVSFTPHDRNIRRSQLRRLGRDQPDSSQPDLNLPEATGLGGPLQ